jgi:DNA-binding SARP family transcriptional activator
MLTLTTFGGLRLDRDDRPLGGAAVRARSLALLAFVASRRDQGMSRDKVLAHFWPETDTAHARNNLKQTLFIMRRALEEEVATSGPFMRIDPARLRVDMWEFEAALERGDLEAAIRTYSGPFLDGFYVSTLPEFDYWVEGERERLARRYQTALETMAARCTALADTHGAVEWWHRVVEHDPLSSRSALGLMQALIMDGNRAGALKYAEVHEGLLRAELGVDPDTGERNFVHQLRQFATKHGPRRLREGLRWHARPS